MKIHLDPAILLKVHTTYLRSQILDRLFLWCVRSALLGRRCDNRKSRYQTGPALVTRDAHVVICVRDSGAAVRTKEWSPGRFWIWIAEKSRSLGDECAECGEGEKVVISYGFRFGFVTWDFLVVDESLLEEEGVLFGVKRVLFGFEDVSENGSVCKTLIINIILYWEAWMVYFKVYHFE